MDLERLFKNLIIWDFIVFAIVVVAGAGGDASYDPTSILEDPESGGLLLISFALLVFYPVLLIFLYKLHAWAKAVYVPLYAMSLALVFAFPLELIHAPSHLYYVLESVGALINGAMIVLMYSTELKNKFH